MIMFSAFGTAAANGGGIDEKTARKLLEEEVSIPPFSYCLPGIVALGLRL
jgi:hypothetical protein